MNRKIVCLLLASMLSLSISACGNVNGVNSSKDVDSEVSVEQAAPVDTKADAKTAYSKIGSAFTKTDDVSKSMSSAWQWCINAGSEVDSYNYVLYLASASGLESKDIIQAYSEINKFGDDGLYIKLKDFSIGVTVVLKAHMNKGTSEDIQKLLNEAKELIKSCDESASYYQDLKEYYTTVNNYYNFVFAPDCSYRDLGSRISEYTTKIDSLKSNLSFDLE